ncbi:MAG: hypothetical protein ACFFAJ_10770 [Candidatus Hodarchaeota archaeon]
MNEKKNTILTLKLGLKLKIQISVVMLLLTLLVHPSATHAETVVLEDNFNDGDLEGWELVTYYSTDPLNVGYVKGEVLIRNENYQMLSINPRNETHEGINWAERNSTQVNGHWSFDVNTTAGSYLGFFFICRDVTPETDFEDEEWTHQTPIGLEGYCLFITTHPRGVLDHFTLGRIDPDYITTDPDEDNFLDSLNLDDTDYDSRYDVFDIEITRKPDGNITVFVKPTIDNVYTKAMSVIDNTYTVSDRVVFWNEYVPSSPSKTFDTSYDNIRVDDNSSWVPKEWIPPKSASGWTPIVVFLAFITIILQKRRKGGR